MQHAGGSREMVPVGRVRRPVGLKGEISITAYGEDAARFKPGMSLVIDGRNYSVSSSRRGPSNSVLLRLEGIDHIDLATPLRGSEILAAADDLPDQPDGVYYHFQLIGLEVQTVSGDNIGRVKEIMETGGNDVYVVTASGGQEVLVPALKEIVVGVDLAAGRMTIDPPPGLIQ